MKHFNIILLILLSFSLSAQMYVDSDFKSSYIHETINEYRSSNNLPELVLDTVGSNIISNKTRWQSLLNIITHDTDPNDSWSKCETSAVKLIESLGYDTYRSKSVEIAVVLPIEYTDTLHIEDSILNQINSKTFAKRMVDSWKSSPDHNRAMLMDINGEIKRINKTISDNKSKSILDQLKCRVKGEEYIESDTLEYANIIYVASVASSCEYSDDQSNINTTCVITAVYVR